CAVTGGTYRGVEEDGFVRDISSKAARLVVADVSDPVRPQIIPKELGGEEKAYHAEFTLSPLGFTDVALGDRDLLVTGGHRLYRFDVTLPADPLLLDTIDFHGQGSQPDFAYAVALKDDLVFVSTDTGVRVLRFEETRRLGQVDKITAQTLGGAPRALRVAGDKLWVAVPDALKLAAIDLQRGLYDIDNTVRTVDFSRNEVRP